MAKTYKVDEVKALLASTRIALWPVVSENENAPAYNGYADFRESGVEATDDASFSAVSYTHLTLPTNREV